MAADDAARWSSWPAGRTPDLVEDQEAYPVQVRPGVTGGGEVWLRIATTETLTAAIEWVSAQFSGVLWDTTLTGVVWERDDVEEATAPG